VKFSQDDIEGWTPVVRKCSTKRRGLLYMYAQNQHDESNESSDEELRITQVTRRVKYQVVDGVPPTPTETRAKSIVK
jgi:hypothetical protein